VPPHGPYALGGHTDGAAVLLFMRSANASLRPGRAGVALWGTAPNSPCLLTEEFSLIDGGS
jgi:hypothetical protein